MPVVALTNRRTFFGLYAPEVLVIFFGVICWQLFLMLGIPLRHPWQYYYERVYGNFKIYFICLLLTPAILRLFHIRSSIKFRQGNIPGQQPDPSQSKNERRQTQIVIATGLFVAGFLILGLLNIQNLIYALIEALAAALVGLLFARRFRPVPASPKAEIGIPLKFTLEEYKRLYLAPKSLLFDLRMIHAISAMFVVFINLKHLIPFINSHLFDQHFADVEYQWFGKLMTVWLVQKLGTGFGPFLSDGYQFWYAYLGITSLLMILQRDRLLAEEYTAGFILMWLLGIVVVYFVPSWGPCYYYKQHLAGVVPLSKMNELQDGLWKLKEYVAAHPQSLKGVFMISGFPSLHFAACVLATYYFWRLSRPLAYLSLFFTGVTFLSTIYFGWHYLMDDIGAVVLVAVVIVITRRFYRTILLFVEPRPEVIKMGTI